MSFDVSSSAYSRFMGAYSEPLSVQFADLAKVRSGQRALDVGAGPGALTAVLADRLGSENVATVDPSVPFVAALRERLPDVDVHESPAEELPFDDDSFDVVLAQLSVHFMSDPDRAAAQMLRVARPNGVVAACVWDYGGRRGPASHFFASARELDPAAPDESDLTGVADGQLVDLLQRNGAVDVVQRELVVDREFATFEDWWSTFTVGVGPAGAYLASLAPPTQDEMRVLARQRLGPGPLTVRAVAWAARGEVRPA